MAFQSILYNNAYTKSEYKTDSMPYFFSDLNLDQLIQEILSEKEEYQLESFFYSSLDDISAICYRQEVMKEVENEDVLSSLCSFSRSMKKVREYMGFVKNIRHKQQREKWHLDSVCLYCKTILDLDKFFSLYTLESEGLRCFGQWLKAYTNSKFFCILSTTSFALSKEFTDIKYSIQIERDKLVVSTDVNESDYSAALIKTFEKINESIFDYKICFFTDLELCSLEMGILEILQKDNTEAFRKSESFYREYPVFLDPVVVTFDREIQFYISYIEFIGRLKQKGYQFTYPNISETKSFDIAAGYDLALASKLSVTGQEIIPNDLYLDSDERIAILTGPNQGGKTTYARTFGQILQLSSIGCPVPCKRANIFLFDRLFTHFSEEEKLSSQAGRLKEELVRLRQVLKHATPRSIIIINELFTTTTSFDAYTMGKKILEHFISLDCFCMYVTHIYELTHLSRKVASFTATVDADRKEARTYRIMRKAADGKAYANTIAEKYRLDYSSVKERITQ